jgi:hypothetical protein
MTLAPNFLTLTHARWGVLTARPLDVRPIRPVDVSMLIQHPFNGHAELKPLKMHRGKWDPASEASASEAYVERVFSVCGDLCAGKRSRMSVNLEQRVFLRMNKQLTATR